MEGQAEGVDFAPKGAEMAQAEIRAERRKRIRRDRAAMAKRALVKGGYLGEQSPEDLTEQDYRAIGASLLADLIYLAATSKVKTSNATLHQICNDASLLVADEFGDNNWIEPES